MPLVRTEEITPETRFDPATALQVYCGLDCGVTVEVLGQVRSTLPGGRAPAIYQFARALQAPCMEMMQRGFLVNEGARRSAAEALRARQAQINVALQAIAEAVWDKPLNPASPKQLADFFYRALHLPEVWISSKGERKLSTSREALEKLDEYLFARPAISCILSIRDLAKQLEVMENEIDPDGRFRASYNIAGTETGRLSSSKNAFGTGRNAQNIAPNLRYVFVADPGWKLCVIDLEQVEARDVGWIIGTRFGDWRFLDSCESGDLHTNNARLVWPELGWTGEPKADRAVADQNFYREYSFRDMAKRGGHLTNYYGTAWTMARSLKVPQKVAEEFQARYCRGGPGISPAFGAITDWWQDVATKLQTTHYMETAFGRGRHFFGRPGDDTTLREAIAFEPQSTTADRTNLGLWRIWHRMPQVQVLAQTHDSVTFQFQESGADAEQQVVGEALEHIRVELRAKLPSGTTRKFIVPGEAKIGWNWGGSNAKNPDGLLKWKSGTPDTRQRAVGRFRIAGAGAAGGR